LHEGYESNTTMIDIYTKQNNKGKRDMIFKEGDWVWLHL